MQIADLTVIEQLKAPLLLEAARLGLLPATPVPIAIEHTLSGTGEATWHVSPKCWRLKSVRDVRWGIAALDDLIVEFDQEDVDGEIGGTANVCTDCHAAHQVAAAEVADTAVIEALAWCRQARLLLTHHHLDDYRRPQTATDLLADVALLGAWARTGPVPASLTEPVAERLAGLDALYRVLAGEVDTAAGGRQPRADLYGAWATIEYEPLEGRNRLLAGAASEIPLHGRLDPADVPEVLTRLPQLPHVMVHWIPAAEAESLGQEAGRFRMLTPVGRYTVEDVRAAATLAGTAAVIADRTRFTTILDGVTAART